MTPLSPERGGYAWTEWLAAEMENHPMPDTWPTDLREQHLAATAEVTHRCPIGADATTPCCDKSPFELPRTDRLTLDNSRVTCAPAPTIVYHWTSRLLPPAPADPAEPYDHWDPRHEPRADPDDSYECGLRDVHNDGEHHRIGWVDTINPASDREQWQWVPYYLISYPDTANIKPLRVCEDCATYLTTLAPYLREEASTAKITDRIAFDYPTADALDALYYLAHTEDPETRERIDLDKLDAHGRSVLGSRTLYEVFTPLTASRAVLLQRLPHIDAQAFDAALLAIHVKATGLLYNAGPTEDLIKDLAALNKLINTPPKRTA